MKIESITLREIRMPLVHFFETSFGRTTERRILLLTLHTDGAEGWGECVAGEDPFYSEESVDTAWYAIEHYLGPALLGKTIQRACDAPALFERVRGHRMAKGALGRGGPDQTYSFVATAWWKPRRDCLRRLHWHSKLSGAVAGKN